MLKNPTLCNAFGRTNIGQVGFKTGILIFNVSGIYTLLLLNQLNLSKPLIM